MESSFIHDILLDGLFAAIAAIGFAIISNPPCKAFIVCPILAAVGHGLRYFLLNCSFIHMDISTASFFAALCIGLLAIPFAQIIHCPAEVFSFPSLLPMIPGMYAYRSVLALTKFIQTSDSQESLDYVMQFSYNGITATFILFALVVGTAIPIFLFSKQSFSATRLLNKIKNHRISAS